MGPNKTKQKVVDLHFRHPGHDLGFEVVPLQALFAKEKEVDHSLEKDPQRLNFYLCIVFTKGNGSHIVDFTPYAYEPGSIFFISKYQVHNFKVNRANDGFLFVFTEQFIYDHRTGVSLLNMLHIFDNLMSSPKLPANPSQTTELRVLADQIIEEYGKPFDHLHVNILRNLFLTFILKAERVLQSEMDVHEGESDYRSFRDFRESLEHYYREYHNVQDYARLLSSTPKKLNALVKRVAGKTAKQFVDERIVLEAKRILSIGDMSAQEVAFSLGFGDPTYFIKYFKRHTRQTPKAFQKGYTKILS